LKSDAIPRLERLSLARAKIRSRKPTLKLGIVDENEIWLWPETLVAAVYQPRALSLYIAFGHCDFWSLGFYVTSCLED